MPTPTPTKLAVVRGDVPRPNVRGTDRRRRDGTRVFFDGEFRNAIIRMCSEMRRQPSARFYEIRRDGTRNDRPWSRLLRTIDEAVTAGAPREQVHAFADLLHAYIDARFNERPATAMSDMLEKPIRVRGAA